MGSASYMVREELFDISDVLGRLNNLHEECISQTRETKFKFGTIKVADVNNDHLGWIKWDGTEFVFVPQVLK